MANKGLVAVFSASGVTKRVGQEIARISGGDFFEIVPKERYTNADLNYMNSRSRSSVEMNDPSARPAIAGRVSDMDSYDTVIIGFPIWWGVAPRIIETFLERAMISPERRSSRSAHQAEAELAEAIQSFTRTSAAM